MLRSSIISSSNACYMLVDTTLTRVLLNAHVYPVRHDQSDRLESRGSGPPIYLRQDALKAAELGMCESESGHHMERVSDSLVSTASGICKVKVCEWVQLQEVGLISWSSSRERHRMQPQPNKETDYQKLKKPLLTPQTAGLLPVCCTAPVTACALPLDTECRDEQTAPQGPSNSSFKPASW